MHWVITDKPKGRGYYNPRQWNLLHRPSYDYALVWSWQTELTLHMWTPEVYESVALNVTVARVLTVDEVKTLRANNDHGTMRKYLRFDFDVKVRVRELDHTWSSLFKSTLMSSRPADVRIQSDTGEALPADPTAFSIICEESDIDWPPHETYPLDEGVRAVIKKVGSLSNFDVIRETDVSD